MIDSIKDEVRKRFAHPIGGAFLVAWSAWNYRLILVVVSPGGYADKLTYIETHWPHSASSTIGSVLPPLVFSVVYTMVSPWALVVLAGLNGFVDRALRRVRLWHENKAPVSSEELAGVLGLRDQREADLHATIRTLESKVNSSNAAASSMRSRARLHLYERSRLFYELVHNGHSLKWPVVLEHLPEGGLLSPRLISFLQRVGLPWASYRMMQQLDAAAMLGADQLARAVGLRVDSDEPDELLFLIGADLVELAWDTDPTAGFRLTTSGRALLELCGPYVYVFVEMERQVRCDSVEEPI